MIMEQKINIAELLKDCPKGMELDCTMYENVEFDYVEQSHESIYPIRCLMKTNGGYNSLFFTYNGCNDVHPNAKCVIFPKGKTTWEGFQRPFKDGDVIATNGGEWIGIMAGYGDRDRMWMTTHCVIKGDGAFEPYFDTKRTWIFERLATEEEKQKLFQTIKDNGYKWNAQTKTLEKLVEPKFKKSDKIKDKNNRIWYVVQVGNKHFDISRIPNCSCDGSGYFVPMEDQDEYELFPDKEYPKTYEECRNILKIGTFNNVDGYKDLLLMRFQRLLICRDAYWKIAGEEMGLGKPWKPDWTSFEPKYIIYYESNGICFDEVMSTNTFLAFPTAEMRDAFYENFKEEIEICKEFL